MSQSELTLSDLGERRIIMEILPKYVIGVGDDCAIAQSHAGHIAVTTDPVPKPAAHVIGGDDDLYWAGWLLVTINASDVAASGARASVFLAALDLPTNTTVASLERLLAGIKDSCTANGLAYVGGNLREARDFAAVGTAIGFASKPPMSRKGARADDLLVVFGKSGQFWCDAMRCKSGIAVDKNSSPLFSPISQVGVIFQLHDAGLLNCAMDTSDGLAPTLTELSIVNHLAINVDLDDIRSNTDFVVDGIRSEKLWFGWGDWTVVAAVAPDNIQAVKKLMARLDRPWSVIGTFREGAPLVRLHDENKSCEMSRLESERFAKDSWFTEGIDGYIRRLLKFQLPT
jgi:thiamine-monophosphate kinase